MSSPAERFRNELTQRLRADGNISFPSANILLGVIIDGMEYNSSAKQHPLAQTTLQNVLKVSNEIECLGRVLELKIRVKYKSVKVIPPLTLQALHSFSLPPAALLKPKPQVVTYMTYIAIVYRLSAHMGPQAVRELVKDFNRTVPNKTEEKVIRKVPGVGPRVVKRNESTGPVRRVREGLVGFPPPVTYRSPAMTSRDRLIGPTNSVERLANPMHMRSTDRLVTTTPTPHPFAAAHMRSRETIGRNEPLVVPPQPRLRHTASRETQLRPTLIAHEPRRMRSQEIFTTTPSVPVPPISLTLPTRSRARPYPYPYSPTLESDSVQVPDTPTTTSTFSSKRKSLRGLEYIRDKLSRISKFA